MILRLSREFSRLLRRTSVPQLTTVRAVLYCMCMAASTPAPTMIDDGELIAELVQLLREEVVPVATSGANWKVIINGKGLADWSFVIEKHGGRRQGKRPG